MLDIQLIRENPKWVQEQLAKKGARVDFKDLLDWDQKKRELIFDTENLKANKNKVSGEIPVMKKRGEDTTTLFEEMKQLTEDIKRSDAEISLLEGRILEFMSGLPNLPDEQVLPGGKENNQVVKTWGEEPAFSFEPKNHVDLAENLGLIDYKRGAKLGGNGFWVYRKDGALLEWALLNYFIEEHLKDGYEFLLPPHMLLYKCGFTAGQFPKFDSNVYYMANEEEDKKQFIVPTAETALVNMHMNEFLTEEELPRKYFAYTPCYRKEAGSYRSEERGMIRGHQFNKVEMFVFTKPEDSPKALEELVQKAGKLVEGLGLYHRVTKLAAEDCSEAMAATYDIEVWIPSMEDFKEVSSASNAKDYQARRGNIKFKRKDGKKAELVHTLNGSGLATSRLFPAILEQYQRMDGSVIVPEVLRKWMGKDVLSG
jgi:seryl-tRNA synthetase